MTRTLVILLCQDRELAMNSDLLQRYVLKPLEADLAFCGAWSTPFSADSIALRNQARFIWGHEEPSDWVSALDRLSPSGESWRHLAGLSPMFVGDISETGAVGSCAIVMYWREVLRRSLTDEVLSEYEWIVITRSDFRWAIPHPEVSLLDPGSIYFLDGEHYGGVSDRHVLFHRQFASRVLSVAEPIFHDAERLRRQLLAADIIDLNAERFLWYRLGRLGLKERVYFLPYLGFTVRSESTTTRWSWGEYDSSLGVYVKYSEELRLTRLASRFIRSQDDWRSYFLGFWGLRRRLFRWRLSLEEFNIRAKRRINSLTVVARDRL